MQGPSEIPVNPDCANLPSGPQMPNECTSLHVAVIHNDRSRLRELLSSGEFGVDARNANGTTPLMLACLFGRASVFLSLVRKKASLQKQDENGLGMLEYVKQVSLTQHTLKQYQDITGQRPSMSGRRAIFSILQACIQARNANAANKEAETRSEADIQPATPTTTPADSDIVFLRNDKELRIIEARTLARTEFNVEIGRKSSGAIRTKGEQQFMMLAISGWSGAQGHGALNNKTYSGLVRQLCRTYGFRLQSNYLDYSFKGDPSEQTGAYFSCHVEKLLAVWVLEEALFKILRTRALTSENIAVLKDKIHQLPLGLRRTVIELDHKPCSSCVKFLKLVQIQAGLDITWQSRKWFTPGKRESLRALNNTLVIGRPGGHDTFVNEIDEWNVVGQASDSEDNDSVVMTKLISDSSSSALEDDDNLDWEMVETPLSSFQAPLRTITAAAADHDKPPCPKHAASPIKEWPPKDMAVRPKALPQISSTRYRRRYSAVSYATRNANLDRVQRLDSTNFAIVLSVSSSPNEELSEPFPGSKMWVDTYTSQSQADQE